MKISRLVPRSKAIDDTSSATTLTDGQAISLSKMIEIEPHKTFRSAIRAVRFLQKDFDETRRKSNIAG